MRMVTLKLTEREAKVVWEALDAKSAPLEEHADDEEVYSEAYRRGCQEAAAEIRPILGRVWDGLQVERARQGKPTMTALGSRRAK